jgi:hypothetical protein
MPQLPKDFRYPELTDSVSTFPELFALLDSQYVTYTHVASRTKANLRNQLAVETESDIESDDFMSLVVSYPLRVSVVVNDLFGTSKQLPINVTLVYQDRASYRAHDGKQWRKLVWGTESIVLQNFQD